MSEDDPSIARVKQLSGKEYIPFPVDTQRCFNAETTSRACWVHTELKFKATEKLQEENDARPINEKDLIQDSKNKIQNLFDM